MAKTSSIDAGHSTYALPQARDLVFRLERRSPFIQRYCPEHP